MNKVVLQKLKNTNQRRKKYFTSSLHYLELTLNKVHRSQSRPQTINLPWRLAFQHINSYIHTHTLKSTLFLSLYQDGQWARTDQLCVNSLSLYCTKPNIYRHHLTIQIGCLKILLKIYLHYYFCSSVSLILTGYLYSQKYLTIPF